MVTKTKRKKKGANKPGYDFLIAELKKNSDAEYPKLKAKAEKKGLTVFPIMYGRAKLSLGLVKPAKRATKKKANTRTKASRPRGRPKGSRAGSSKSERIRELLGSGMANAEIAKKVGCSINLVYAVTAKSGGGRKGRAAPRRAAKATKSRNGARSVPADSLSLSGFVERLEQMQRDREAMQDALAKIRELVAALT